MGKAAAPRYSGKIHTTTTRIFPLYENYLHLRSFETYCQQPAGLNWGGERKGSLMYVKWVPSRQTIVGKEWAKEGVREKEVMKVAPWHHKEGISHTVYLWESITLVNDRQTVWDLQKPFRREDSRTRWLQGWSSPFKPDNWPSGWTLATYVSLSGGVNGPHASDKSKSVLLSGLRCKWVTKVKQIPGSMKIDQRI